MEIHFSFSFTHSLILWWCDLKTRAHLNMIQSRCMSAGLSFLERTHIFSMCSIVLPKYLTKFSTRIWNHINCASNVLIVTFFLSHFKLSFIFRIITIPMRYNREKKTANRLSLNILSQHKNEITLAYFRHTWLYMQVV